MHTEYLTISSGVDSEMMVIIFKPGGFFTFINTSLAVYSNRVVPADELIGQDILWFREEIKEGMTPELKIKMAVRWLNSHCGKNSFTGQLVQHFVTAILQTPEFIDLRSMVQKSGYSHKQFIHLFKKTCGANPQTIASNCSLQ